MKTEDNFLTQRKDYFNDIPEAQDESGERR